MYRSPARLCILATVLVVLATSPAWTQQRPPAPKVEFLAPSPSETLTGTVNIRVKITAPEGVRMPSSLRAGFGGPPWVAMEQVQGSNEWTGQLDTTMAPNGTQTLVVVTSEKRARAEIGVQLQNPLKVFFADLHSHTSYSDGTLLPSDAHQYARDEAKLDVFSLTDHLEKVDDPEWLDSREVAWDANVDGEFVAIPGLEWTKKLGHANIYDPKTRHWPEELAEFYQAVADAGVVAKFNHPGDGSKVFDGLAYSEVGDQAFQLMEVRRDEEEKAFLRALANGWHIAPEGSDDTHSPNWGNCARWTGILAPGLSKRNILDALKNRRVYSTLDRNCKLFFSVNGAPMGTVVSGPVPKIEVEVVAEDPDSGDSIAKIELFENGQVVETHEPNRATCQWKVTRSPGAGQWYYFVKITQTDGNQIWSAPVWVTVAGPEESTE